MIALQTGSTATGRAGVQRPGATCLIANNIQVFETLLVLSTLSTSTEEYVLQLGFGTPTFTADQVDGIYVEYDRATADDFWRIATSAASIRTKTTTTSAVINSGTDAGFTRLRFHINGTSSIEFFINDVSVGTISTNLPTNTTALYPFMNIRKTVGTTNRRCDVDYVMTGGWHKTYRGEP